LLSPAHFFFSMMFEAFGFSKGTCGAETYLSYLRGDCFGGYLRYF